VKRLFQVLFVLLAPALSVPAQNIGATAPDFGNMTSSNLLPATSAATNPAVTERQLQLQLLLAQRQRHEKDPGAAVQTLVGILETNGSSEIKRKALFELALATQDNNEYVKAQQIFAQYLQRYSEDPSAPEVLLRQGLLYRQMGVNTLAVSKFYAVMSTALKLKLGNVEYYQNLVLQAQTEIADTYYVQGQFAESADFYSRLLKSDRPGLNREQIEYKMIRSLANLTNHSETISCAQKFLEEYRGVADVPEVRFILASGYKAVGRNTEAMKEVLLLMQTQQDSATNDPDLWIYWQRRAGNEIANQLYKEGDYVDALQVYQSLAAMDNGASWQAPALYQVGLVYEQLQQWQKASEIYGQILARREEMTGTNAPPSLSSLSEMAQWRKDYIAWMLKAREENVHLERQAFFKQTAASTNTSTLR
jgi:tetratricopeptide (TPR) repeat protein